MRVGATAVGVERRGAGTGFCLLPNAHQPALAQGTFVDRTKCVSGQDLEGLKKGLERLSDVGRAA